MTDPRHHQTPPDPDDLFAFAEHNTAPRNDLEATLRRVQRATGSQGSRTEVIPTDLKTQIWEELMSAHPHTAPQPGQVGLPSLSRPRPQTPAGTTPPHDRHSTRAAQLVARWQPALSLAVVAAVLVALVGGAWYRGVWNEPGSNNTIPALADASPSSDAVNEIVPVVEADCMVANPLTDDEVSTIIANPGPMPIRSKEPVGPADPEVRDAVDVTARAWVACGTYGSIAERATLQSRWATSHGTGIDMNQRLSSPADELQTFDANRPIGEAMYAADPFTSWVPTNLLHVDDQNTAIPDFSAYLPLPDSAIELADGRVAVPVAILYAADDPMELQDEFNIVQVHVFIQQDGAWVMDEAMYACFRDCDQLREELIRPAATPASSPVASPEAAAPLRSTSVT